MRSPVDRSTTKLIKNTGDLVPSPAATGRADLTDAQWAILEPLLPVGKKPGRPPLWSKRQLLDGIGGSVSVRRGVTSHPVYGCWQTVYGLFRRWQRAGVWALSLAALQTRADAAGLITWEVSVDSTINRAHQHAAGARIDGDLQKEPPGGLGEPEPADHALGRSREAGRPSCTWPPSKARSHCRYW
ncbi:transposase [Amycolatopsis sp. NPDC051758]|uniref:transposase n=1 Tax=Amycolatopsis sp. NPDC051758 TaxID=3363935 RepID=UPI0037AD9056